jgi:uncharacterized protein
LGIETIEYGGTTNGILYTPDKVEWTANNKSLFMFSHDGIKPAHDRYRKMPNGKGSFDIVDRNLRLAKEIVPNIKSRMTISVANLPYLFESIQYFVEEIGLDNIAFSPVFEDIWDDAAFDLLEEQFEKIINYTIKKYKEGTYFTLKHLNDIATKTKSQVFNPCGYCFPCHRFNKHGLSTVERSKLPTIIARPKGDSFEWCNNEWRKTFNFVETNPSKCSGCELIGLGCNGNCYAVNYDLTGSIREQNDIICRFNWIQHEAGMNFKKLAQEEGVRIDPSGWNGEGQAQNNQGLCICYNMCYLEGTKNEKIHIDRSTDMTCICNQTSYNGSPNPQHRTIGQIDRDRNQKKKFLELSRKILLTRDEDKTEEERKLEDRVLDITLKMLSI